MPRLIRNTTVLLKSEDTYGINAMPGATDGVLVLTGVDFQPDFKFVDREVARPGLGASPQLMGAQIAKLDFRYELANSGTTAAPSWTPAAKACGFALSALANPGRHEFLPVSTGFTSATAYVYSDGVLYIVVGCLGNAEYELLAGSTPKIKISLQGLYVSESEATIAVPAMAAWKAPVVLAKSQVTDFTRGCTYASGALAGGVLHSSRGMTIRLGNQVDYIEMCSNDFMAITQREVVASVTFDLTAAQEVAFINRMRTGVLDSFGFTLGNTDANKIILYAPAAQFSAPRIVDVSGVRLMQFDATLTPTGAGNDEFRLICPTYAGVAPPPPPPPPPPDLNPPTLASFATYQTSATTWEGIPYKVEGDVQAAWSEPALGGAAVTEFDLTLPTGTAPAGGWPIAIHNHRTTNSGYQASLQPGSPEYDIRTVLLAAGYAIVNGETRHPATTLPYLAPGAPAPYWDFGHLVQHVRSAATAFNLNTGDVSVFCRSRGCTALWTALAPDMANASGTTHAALQSSRPQRVWVMQGQDTWRPDQFIDRYVQPADRSAAKTQYPTDPRLIPASGGQPSIYELVATTNSPVMVYFESDGTWYDHLLTLSEAQAADQNHFPNYGQTLYQAFVAAGKRSQIVVNHGVPVGDNAKVAPWFTAHRTVPTSGISPAPSAAELAAIVESKRTAGCNLFYLRPDASGAAVNADGTGTIAVGTKAAVVVDGGEGLANRLLGTGALGDKAVMGTLANQPTVSASGGKWLLDFGATGVLQVTKTNATAEAWVAHAAAFENGLLSRVNGSYKWGKVSTSVGLGVGIINASLSAQNLRVFKQLGMEITGATYDLAV